MEEIRNILEQRKDKFLQELLEFLRIPSVSADPRHKADMSNAANFLIDQFNTLDLARVELYPTAGYPIVYGETAQDSSRPTVLVYGHYDVQPPDPLDLWNSPPFEPVIKDGKIFARGACDDKGQVFMHVKAFEIMNELKMLPCNVKFMIEGEEEVGSANLENFIKKHTDMLSCDVILVSDTSMIANETPSLTTGLRGLSYVEVEVTAPNRDTHSGADS